MAIRREKADDQLSVQLRGKLAKTPHFADGEDLYSIFYSTAAYLGFDNGTLGLWGMNFARLQSLCSGLDVIAEFQVGPLLHSTELIPQFFKCADMSLMRLVKFELAKVEVKCEPGRARNMTSRLSSSLGLFRALVPTRPVRSLASLIWHSDANLQELDLAKLYSESDIEPFEIVLESDPTFDRSDRLPLPRRRHATATVILPELSLNCVGWIVSFLISSLAPVRAEDITVLLELE